MAPKKSGGGSSKRKLKPAAAPAAAPAPAGPQDANELEELPDNNAYESLDEADAPPRGDQLMEDEQLAGLPETAPATEPAVDLPPGMPDMIMKVKLPANAKPGMSLQATCGRQKFTFKVPAGAAPGSEIQIKVPRTPLPAATPAPTAPAAAPAPAPKQTGAAEATKKLTAAQERNQAGDAKWQRWDPDKEPISFGRPDFRPYKEGAAPEGFVPDPSCEAGGPRPGHGFTSQTHPVHFVAAQGFDAKLFRQIEAGTNEYAAAHGAGSKAYWAEYKPFDTEEIMAGCGLLLRAGRHVPRQSTRKTQAPRPISVSAHVCNSNSPKHHRCSPNAANGAPLPRPRHTFCVGRRACQKGVPGQGLWGLRTPSQAVPQLYARAEPRPVQVQND